MGILVFFSMAEMFHILEPELLILHSAELQGQEDKLLK